MVIKYYRACQSNDNRVTVQSVWQLTIQWTLGFLGNSIGVLDLYSRYDSPKRISSSLSSKTFTKNSNAGAKRISTQRTNSVD